MPTRKNPDAGNEKQPTQDEELLVLDEIARRAFAKYSEETCTICGSRFDEHGYCACGAGGN